MTLDIRKLPCRRQTLRRKLSTMSAWHILSEVDTHKEHACLSSDDEDGFTLIEETCANRPKPHVHDEDNEQFYDSLEAIPSFLRCEESKNVKFERSLEQYKTERQRTKIQLIKLVIRDISESDHTTNRLFSFQQHPATWFDNMIHTYSHFSIDIRIMQSVGRIYNELGTPGLLQVIVWANASDGGSSETKFWQKVEHAALGLPGDEAYLVHLKGDLKIFEREVKSNVKHDPEKKNRNMEYEAYCGITKTNGFESIKFEDGKALARSIKRFTMP